jgi:hypothetical protein
VQVRSRTRHVRQCRRHTARLHETAHSRDGIAAGAILPAVPCRVRACVPCHPPGD